MPAVSSIAALLLSVLVLITGNGLLNTLIPMRTKLDGFPALATGLMGSAYFLGMLLGTFLTPLLIRRCGALPAFALFAALTVGAALIFPALPHPAIWILLRGVIGFAFAGLYAVIEAWLTARSSNVNRGRVYALYQIVTFVGSAAGQESIVLTGPHADLLFILAAACIGCSILPLVLSKTVPPRPSRTVTLRLGWLTRLSPVGAFAALAIGAANGSFYSLAPVYGLGLGMSPPAVALFMTTVIAGTALAVYPVARLSDAHDRRIVLLVFCAIGALAESMLSLSGHGSGVLMTSLGFAVGASTMVLYTVAISHVNDYAGPEHSIAVSSGMLFLYCVGAIIGPALASTGMSWFGPSALFVQNATVHALLAGFVVWRLLMRDSAARATPVHRLTTRPGLS